MSPVPRTWYDTLVNDDGSNLVGTLMDKDQMRELLESLDLSVRSFNVKSYGAVGDGVANDAAALQAACDAATPVHGVVLIPDDCTLRITSAVTGGAITLFGVSRDTSRIFVDFDGVGVTLDGDSLSSAHVRDLSFVGELVFSYTVPTRTSQVGVLIATTPNSTIEGCAFTNLYTGATIQGDSYYSTVEKNLFLMNKFGLTAVAGPGSPAAYPNELNIIANQFNGQPVSQGGPGGTKGIVLTYGSGMKLIGNGFENFAVGVDLAHTEFDTLVGNRFEDNTAHIAQDSTIHSNILIGGYDDTGHGFRSFIGLRIAVTGSSVPNTILGDAAMASITIGLDNCAIGRDAAGAVSTGTKNTAVGAATLASANNDRCVALGYAAGLYETGNNKLFIDAFDRGSEANGRAKALMYGLFDSDPANQTLQVNAKWACNQATPQAPYASGGALAAYGAGANGFDTGAHASELHAMVVKIRAALVANGIMS